MRMMLIGAAALLIVPAAASAAVIPGSGIGKPQTEVVLAQKKKADSGSSCFSRCAAKGGQPQRCEIRCRGSK